MIKINSKEIAFSRPNFWNHIHFHPTDAIEDAWGKALLDDVAKDKVAKYVRMYTMLEDIVSLNEDGTLTYDFSELDYRLGYLNEKGFGVVLCVNFLPKALAADPTCCSGYKRYKGKNVFNSKPRDYKEWQEVCRAVLAHLVDKFGIEVVGTWYIQCWNEPNHRGFWMDNEPDWHVRSDEYLKLYDYFAEGIKSVSEKIKIGGPVLGYNFFGYPKHPGYDGVADMAFLHKFFKHIKEEKNHANGGIGTAIDFFSMHVYGADHKFNPLDPMDSYNIAEDHINIAKEYGYGDLEMIGDEFEATTEGYLGVDFETGFDYRNSERFPAYYFALIDIMLQKKSALSKLLICLSGGHHLTKEFGGQRTFVTKSGIKLPIYNGYKLAALLGENFVPYTNDTKVGVIPTVDEEGNIVVALYNYTANKLKLKGTQHVAIEVELPEGEYSVSHYRLDADHGNTYTAWKKLGYKNDLTQMEREAVVSAGEKTLWYEAEDFVGGTYSDKIVMTDDAVSVIKFTRKR